MALPKETLYRIEKDANAAASKVNDTYRERETQFTNRISFLAGYKEGHIAGGTAENERAQKMAEALRGCIGTIIFWYEVLSQTQGFGLVESEYLEAKNQSIKRIEAALQQWNAGELTKFEGSIITEPAHGISLGCISPEARELLDTIMKQWEKHYTSMKEMHGDAMPETTFYGFAYWLVRWSGLIQPSITSPTK